ncbi:zinc metalloprotease HtpX [Breoghania sp.]|uniref:zinc metalloprotease HtpX n=1 Tax=Breoghania sp. TaxID=2065378 RepID=UPI002AAA838F|nr:zinc metalloprotease HtpX [Breoghania sp.]
MMEPLQLRPALRRRRKIANMLHTWLLAGGSLSLLAACAWALAGLSGLVWITIGGAVSLIAATNVSPLWVLRLYRARRLPERVFPEGHDVVRALSLRAGLPSAPELYYIPSSMLNAFTVGRPENAVVCVTDGLLRQLTLREFAGVMAHELSHIANGDVKVMALADVVARMTSSMSIVGLFMLAFNLPVLIADGGGVPWLGIFLLLAAPTIGGLLQLALSRTREYDADLDAVGLTGDPHGLVAALTKLESIQGRRWEAMALPGSRIPEPSLLRTHPTTAERVRRILDLVPGQEARMHDHFPDVPARIGRSLVPSVGKPRMRVRGLGHWY